MSTRTGYVMTAIVVTMGVISAHGSMINKCMKVLVNEEFNKPCSMLDTNHIKPCLVQTQQDADVLIAAKIIGDGPEIPRNHICAARKELGDADCISVHVRPDPQQVWQWTEWRYTSYGIVRNVAITEGGTDYTCPYEERYIGPVHTGCEAAYLSGERTSGVYTMLLDANTALNVYCEHGLKGGGWTVIQRRQDGQENFYRTWAEYKVGFGDLEGEFWLGNDNIHQLTKNQDQQVMFKLGSADGEEAIAVYNKFWIGDEHDEYELTIAEYSGAVNPGDSLTYHNGQMFTTKDRDNDQSTNGNCAVRFRGAWWHGNCHHSNLNGDYGNTLTAEGLNWYTWKGFQHSMSYTAIMVKKAELPLDCLDAYNKGMTTSGVYTIQPDGDSLMEVYCDQEWDNGGWTVIQRRQDGQEDFSRTWTEYKVGFGDLEDEFWLGNDNIHLLTKNNDQQVKFHMRTLNGESADADYSQFSVDGASLKYKLHISGYLGTAIPGDSMIRYQNGHRFSTPDQDNDVHTAHCADHYSSAWWYGAPCHHSNLNGVYGSTVYGQGINWYTWKGLSYSMAYTAIMVRRK